GRRQWWAARGDDGGRGGVRAAESGAAAGDRPIAGRHAAGGDHLGGGTGARGAGERVDRDARGAGARLRRLPRPPGAAPRAVPRSLRGAGAGRGGPGRSRRHARGGGPARDAGGRREYPRHGGGPAAGDAAGGGRSLGGGAAGLRLRLARLVRPGDDPRARLPADPPRYSDASPDSRRPRRPVGAAQRRRRGGGDQLPARRSGHARSVAPRRAGRGEPDRPHRRPRQPGRAAGRTGDDRAGRPAAPPTALRARCQPGERPPHRRLPAHPPRRAAAPPIGRATLGRFRPPRRAV
ncbi:MAG: hypothetical protein AVDCRST_MAG18-181, partial [uncultured Thermomicrobiales bacterium]